MTDIPTSTAGIESVRARAESVPDDLVRAALAAYCTTCAQTVGRQPLSDHEEEVRTILAGALWLHEQQLRERIARWLELRSDKCDQDAESYADERSPLLSAESEALWKAARLIRAGKDEG